MSGFRSLVQIWMDKIPSMELQPPLFKKMRLSTSKTEIKDLLKAWIAISIAFGIILSSTEGYLSAFIISAIAVGFGFLLHELGHKVVAQHYHLFAEFRSFDQMLILAILMSFLGFVFAAPGAVMIHGTHFLDYKKNGKISLAGPLVNLILAIIFLILISLNIFPLLSSYGFMINTWIALFNMIPIWNFDGKKILKWNKFIYFAFILISIILITFK